MLGVNNGAKKNHTVMSTVCACCGCYWFINFKCLFCMRTTSKCAYHVHFKWWPPDNRVNKYCPCQSVWRYEKCHNFFSSIKICVRIFSSPVLTCRAKKKEENNQRPIVFVRVVFVCLVQTEHTIKAFIFCERDKTFYFHNIETNWFFIIIIHAVVNIQQSHRIVPYTIVNIFNSRDCFKF